jgi:hypothetical protein
MLNPGKKLALRATTKINILTLMLSGKKILNETKNHTPPPFKLNGRSLNQNVIDSFLTDICDIFTDSRQKIESIM